MWLASLDGRALPRSPMGARGVDVSASFLAGEEEELLLLVVVAAAAAEEEEEAASASAFSAPTASTMRSLVRLPPKALGMKAFTLGGKRERIEVKRPGSDEAGASGVAEGAGPDRAPTFEALVRTLLPKPGGVLAETAALAGASETKLLAPMERGMVKEVE